MNKEIRLLNELGDPKELEEYFTHFDNEDVLNYLNDQFDALARDLDNNLNPANLVAHLFEVAGYLYGSSYIDDLTQILIKKTEDYNADKIDDPDFRLDSARYDYFPFGEVSYLQMLYTKIHRMKSVSLKEQTNFESLKDSCIDLGSYCIFFYSYLVERDGFR